jgi:hypothetical protein
MLVDSVTPRVQTGRNTLACGSQAPSVTSNCRTAPEVVAIAPTQGSGGSKGPDGGDVADDYEYRPLRIDPTVSRASAAVMLSVRAEFTGWELARVQRYSDGSRRVLLRRRRSQGPFPALSL